MDRHFDVRLTPETLRESRALIAAVRDDDRDALLTELLMSRIGGRRGDNEIIDYLVNVLHATVTHAATLAGIVATYEGCETAAVIRALAEMEGMTGEGES